MTIVFIKIDDYPYNLYGTSNPYGTMDLCHDDKLQAKFPMRLDYQFSLNRSVNFSLCYYGCIIM